MTQVSACPQCGAALPQDAPQGICPKCLLALGFPSGTGRSTDDAGGPASRQDAVRAAPEVSELAGIFPDLEIIELLGQGGMGFVYKARQQRLDRWVALKILPPALAQDPAFAERFAREARAMARLCHPHIVMLFDFGQADGWHFLLVEFVEGVNLRQAMQTGEVTPRQALAIVPQICEALEYAHDMGIVHRDIKPENVLLDRQGHVKIADFGLTKLVEPAPNDIRLTGTQQVMGTPHYMAPEQMEKPAEVDHRADIYALGVVFYELLTGELPIGRFPPPSSKAGVDARLDDVVHRTLEKEPERRYQRASEVKTDLDALAADPRGLGASATRPVTLRRVFAEMWSDRRPIIIPFTKAALFLLYVYFMFQFFRVDGGSYTSYGSRDYTHIVGVRGASWLVIDNTAKYGLQFNLTPIDTSLTVLLLAFAAYYLRWRIRKVETGSTARFRLPWTHLVFWLAVAVVSIGSGLTLETHNWVANLVSLRL